MLKNAPCVYVAGYALLIFVRERWLNVLILTGGLSFYAWQIIPRPLTE